MPKYSVRFYSEYCQEYVVEAASQQEAAALADEYDSLRHAYQNPRYQEIAPLVEPYERTYVGHSDTMINEVDDDGNWLDDN